LRRGFGFARGQLGLETLAIGLAVQAFECSLYTYTLEEHL